MFELCNNCEDRLHKFNKRQYFLRNNLSVEIEWVKQLAQIDFLTSKHAKEKLAELKITTEDIFDYTLTIVEIQVGYYDGDYKFIYKAHNGLHVIFLYSQGKLPTLINVYNPLEGKNFKWNSVGTQRIYLESFVNCCPHPDMVNFVDEKGYYASKDYKERHNQIRASLGKPIEDFPAPVKMI